MAGKGNPKISEYGEKTRFCGCSAVDAAKKRHEKETVTKELMQAVADGLDIDKASQKLVQLIEKGDLNAWKIWLEYTMSKAVTKVEADANMVFSFEVEDGDSQG